MFKGHQVMEGRPVGPQVHNNMRVYADKYEQHEKVSNVLLIDLD